MEEQKILHQEYDGPLVESTVYTDQREPRTRTLIASFMLVIYSLYHLSLGIKPSTAPWETTATPSPSLSNATKILTETPLIDGHNDLLILLRFAYPDGIYTPNFTHAFEHGNATGMVDLARLESGHVGGAFWSAFVPCPANGSDFSSAAYEPYVKMTLEQLDLFARLRQQYPRYFTPAPDAVAAEREWRETGRLVSPLAIEGLHQIGNSLSTLRAYHALGVRYATLTWNCHNRYADAAMTGDGNGGFGVAEPLHHGVSEAGREVVLEMNRLGMLVDLSHVSVETMRDVLGRGKPGWKGSVAPPIFSHSSAYAVCPHPRNVPDDVLWMVKERGSLVMVNFSPDFVSCKAGDASSGLPDFVEETNTLEHVVDHITYIGDLIGYDHVGLGSDFDGIEAAPRGLEDVSKYPDLVDALLESGISEEDAGKIVGRNLLRVWREADEVAVRLQKTMHPIEDKLEAPWL
ncbi:hypothetical protein MBLNU230_g5978t1 [Neophaeotheca triangularis]